MRIWRRVPATGAVTPLGESEHCRRGRRAGGSELAMRITLNLATRPFADLGPALKRLRIAMGALAVVAIGLGSGLHLVHQKAEQARARDHSLDGQIARITRERARLHRA